MNVGDLIRRWGRWTPDRIAVVHGATRTSYGELDRRSDLLHAALLRAGLRSGDRIATLFDNCARHFEIIAAAAKAGCIVVPVNPRLQVEEVAYILRDSGACMLFVSGEHAATVAAARMAAPQLRLLVHVDRDDGDGAYGALLGPAQALPVPEPVAPDLPIFISYTSGTTGKPKGAVMSHRNLMANALNVAYHFELDAATINLVVMPQSTGGCNHHIVVPTLYAGGCFVVEDARNFDPARFFATVQRERVTHVQLVPTMIYRLLDFPDIGRYDLASLKLIGYGSAPMAVERLKEAIARFGPIFCQVYGQTEASSLAVCLSRSDHVAALAAGDLGVFASSGRPINSVDLRIVDEDGRDVAQGEMGEVVLRGATVTAGYCNAPDATAEAIRDGWLHTGDMCREDARGFIYHVDRKKDIIISGAMNISAREIEEVIYRHAGVRECAVIAVPDAHWGEATKAVISVRDGERVTADEIAALCKAHLASFKRPKSIDFIEEFPKNSMGKILKRELKRLYWGDRASLVN